MRSKMPVFVALLLLLGAAAAAADSDPAFGPDTFELTDEPSATVNATFNVANGGPYALFVRNGDGEVSRVDSGTVSINGSIVVSTTELTAGVPGLNRMVALRDGDNEIVIDLTGAAGSFVTVLIDRPEHRPRFIAGRLLLPWARNDNDRGLALALKNGSPNFARRLRVIFFNPDGSVAAASDKLVLPPHGSMAAPVAELIDAGSWQVGSIEIIYSGRGVARLFGTGRQFVANPFDEVEVLPLEHAGAEIFRGHPDPATPSTNRYLRR